MWLRETEGSWSETWNNLAVADLVALELKRSAMYDAPDGSPPLPSTVLGEVSPDSWESLVIRLRPCVAILSTSYDIWDAWLEGSEGLVPQSAPASMDCEYLVYRKGEDVFHERLDTGEARLFKALAQGDSFASACVAYADEGEVNSAVIQAVVTQLMHWFDKELIQAIELN